MFRVFVYGTLKQGFCRHHALESQHFVGTATTEPCYRLFDLGSYPALILSDDGNSIKGELYDIDESCLEKLDQIEGVDEGLYRREIVQLLAPWSDETTITYLYQQSIDGFPEISDWPS